ncbi:MAG: hypothetical protein AB7K37_03410 [Cyclobacteriaceae bacterium]
MENFRAIEFHKERDFSNKLNATFEFIKQNFLPLSKSILFIAGPPVLIGSAMLGNFFGSMFTLGLGAGSNPALAENFFTSANFWLQLGLMFLFLLISGIVSISAINNYILLYGEKKSNKIEVAEVWERVKETFWMYFGTMIFFTLLIIAAYVLMILPVIVLGAISPFLIFFGFIAIVGGFFYLLISSSLTFFVRAYEKNGFFEAITRSFKLVQGKWWSTFGLLFILYLIVSTVSYIFILPWYITTVVGAMHTIETGSFEEPTMQSQIFATLSFMLYYLAQTILYTLPNVGIAFQYFNLVELKEAKGLMQKIDTLGKPDAGHQRPEEHF